MTNHWTTVCTVAGPPSDVEQFMTTHFSTEKEDDGSEYQAFLFETIIPKPAIVDQTESGSEADAGFYALTGMIHVSTEFGFQIRNPMQHYAARGFPYGFGASHKDFAKWLEVHCPSVLQKGRLALQCFRETGYHSWYEWHYPNWGCRGCAYQVKRRAFEPGRFVFEFQTGNAFPLPVFEKLAELYPDLDFQVTTIDEGGPEFEGRFHRDTRTFDRALPTEERYRLVYGRDPDREEDDEDGDEVASGVPS